MSVAVLQSPMSSHFEHRQQIQSWSSTSPDDQQPITDVDAGEDDGRFAASQFDIWTAIQAKKKSGDTEASRPYIHPLVRRSSSLMSQESLETCTESLGSETGSDDYSAFPFSVDDVEAVDKGHVDVVDPNGNDVDEQQEQNLGPHAKELTSVNYHCSTGRRSPSRSFPPPLPSICRRDGPCLHMRPHRRDGRLVVEAVPVPSQNYLHAHRHAGRLLLTVVDASATSPRPPLQQPRAPQVGEPNQSRDDNEDDDDVDDDSVNEEEVEVVDRGTVVEVKVSSQQQQNGGKVQRSSSLVINKFVGGSPLPLALNSEADYNNSTTSSATTAAAAAVAASSFSAGTETTETTEMTTESEEDGKLCFTSKQRNREELIHNMRRCSELRRPLFIWEPCSCIATST